MKSEDIYVELNARFDYPKSDRLISILRKLVTPDEALLILQLPADSAEIARALSLDEEAVNAKLQKIQEKGLVVSTSKGPRLARLNQLEDTTLASSEVDTEYLDLWKDFCEAEWRKYLADHWDEYDRPWNRVIPAWKSIENCPDIPPDQDISKVMEGAQLIAVVPCPCRRTMRECDAPLDVCLQFNHWARFAIDRRAGRELTLDEAIAICKKSEEARLVHVQTMLTSELAAICNCCACCCGLIDTGRIYKNWDRVLIPSQYRAAVDQDLCTGCQDCADACPFEAIEMEKIPGARRLKAAVDTDKCFGCGVCVPTCSEGAIGMRLFGN